MADVGWARGWYKRISGEERRKQNEIENQKVGARILRLRRGKKRKDE